MWSMTSGRWGSFITVPNSVISAPAGNVRPEPMITIAATASSASAAFKQPKIPLRTSYPKALTGGLLISITAIFCSFVRVTWSNIWSSFWWYASAFFRV